MKRLHELSVDEILAWTDARARVGRERYKDAHLQRYGLVDVMEELLDAYNILDLFFDRLSRQDQMSVRIRVMRRCAVDFLGALMAGLQEMDKEIPESVCTDEQGGERIWWSEQAEPTGEEIVGVSIKETAWPMGRCLIAFTASISRLPQVGFQGKAVIGFGTLLDACMELSANKCVVGTNMGELTFTRVDRTSDLEWTVDFDLEKPTKALIALFGKEDTAREGD